MKLYDKEAILAELQRGQAALLHALKDVPEDVAGRAPGPGKWSILECVEHLAVAEEYLLSQMISARQCHAPVVDERREALITARGADRTTRMLSPEAGRPTGRFSTLREATEHFLSTRGRTLGFVENANEDLRCRLTTHPLLGTVNCYEMLLVIAVHPRRHACRSKRSRRRWRTHRTATPARAPDILSRTPCRRSATFGSLGSNVAGNI